MADFLETRDPAKVCRFVRKWIMQFPKYIPEAAYIDCQFTMLVHLDIQGNMRCHFHRWSTGCKIVDGCGTYAVEGTTDFDEVDPETHLDCRCFIDKVLLDLYLWKTGVNMNYVSPGFLRKESTSG